MYVSQGEEDTCAAQMVIFEHHNMNDDFFPVRLTLMNSLFSLICFCFDGDQSKQVVISDSMFQVPSEWCEQSYHLSYKCILVFSFCIDEAVRTKGC